MKEYEELIKALRYCSEASNEMGCSECTVDRTVDCVGKLMRDAADAIERLMAEVDRKDKALQAWVTTWESADAVPVVRCKDCKWFDGENCCEKIGIIVIDAELFYCADGERRTE